jgi:hypothetical protein
VSYSSRQTAAAAEPRQAFFTLKVER